MKKTFIYISILILVLIVSFFVLVNYINNKSSSTILLNNGKIVLIEKGTSLNKISDDIFSNKKDRFWFSKIALLKGKDKEIKTGEFLIPKQTSIEEVLNIISSNNTINYKVTIVEGFQKYQVQNLFNNLKNTKGKAPIINEEGIFMPDTYFYKKGDSKEYILDKSKNKMHAYLSKAWNNRDKTIPIKTKEEALILASIIEKETSQADEYKLVSSVFINRLNKGMKLQADSTSIYGITNGEKKFNRKLYKKDLAIKNEYNTYYINGLPIAPICNPGRQAIDAVMHPEKTNYLYFVADGTGGHIFAKTSKEHEKNVVNWRKIKKGL